MNGGNLASRWIKLHTEKYGLNDNGHLRDAHILRLVNLSYSRFQNTFGDFLDVAKHFYKIKKNFIPK